MRYQQAYAPKPFTDFTPDGLLIQGIGFAQSTTVPFSSMQPSFQVNLSTTVHGPDDLSPTFAENVGVDDTVVFGPAPVIWPNECCGSFLFYIELDRPFLFDPTLGNLLLDIRNFEAENPEPPTDGFLMMELYAQDILGDSTSRLYAPSVNATSGTADTVGLVTLFTVQAVAEPSTSALGGVAVFLFALAVRSKHRKRTSLCHSWTHCCWMLNASTSGLRCVRTATRAAARSRTPTTVCSSMRSWIRCRILRRKEAGSGDLRAPGSAWSSRGYFLNCLPAPTPRCPFQIGLFTGRAALLSGASVHDARSGRMPGIAPRHPPTPPDVRFSASGG
jgi:hypothetical protein